MTISYPPDKNGHSTVFVSLQLESVYISGSPGLYTVFLAPREIQLLLYRFFQESGGDPPLVVVGDGVVSVVGERVIKKNKIFSTLFPQLQGCDTPWCTEGYIPPPHSFTDTMNIILSVAGSLGTNSLPLNEGEKIVPISLMLLSCIRGDGHSIPQSMNGKCIINPEL